jgi:hypothetical protein
MVTLMIQLLPFGAAGFVTLPEAAGLSEYPISKIAQKNAIGSLFPSSLRFELFNPVS